MFIKVKRSGYTRDGQQFCQGLFLILTQPSHDSAKYPSMSNLCSDCGKTCEEHDAPLPTETQAISDSLHRMWHRLFEQRLAKDPYQEDIFDACELILDAKRKVEGCRYFRPSSITYPMRALVRYVAMSQLGHFMMGFAHVKRTRLTLSGSYGSDGLPKSVSDVVYEQGIELPQELYDAWKNGNGWNGAGNEAPKMREWALQNLKELRK